MYGGRHRNYGKNIENNYDYLTSDLYTGDNFDIDKYYYDSLSGMSFNYSNKKERVDNINHLIQETNNNYKVKSEQLVDVLLNNYQTFMNIGKYVERIDMNVTNVLNTQKNYSNLLQNLRKDVEEFTIDYMKYLKEAEEDRNRENDIKARMGKFNYEEIDTAYDSNFQIEYFLNPDKGSKRWIEEQPEKLRVLIDEKKFLECINLIKEIRSCNLEKVDYDVKIELDQVYNYLIEKLTICISRCSSFKDVKIFLDYINSLGCVGLAIDTFLNWLSKKLKNKINKFQNSELNKSEKEGYDKKILKIIDDYYSTLEKFIKIMEDYFKLSDNYSNSPYIVSWIKQETQIMTKSIEGLFTRITSLVELKNLMRHINKLFNDFDIKGISAKYIFDLHFINNFKISLEAINNNCMKIEGVDFDLKDYEIKYDNRLVKISCVSEIGNSVSNVAQLISDFILEFINNKTKFTGIIFIEEFFFEDILSKEFLNFIKAKITKNMSNNYEVKTFYDNQESLATSNQILINYGISILSIETLFDFLYNEMSENKLISTNSIEAMKNMKFHLNETKNIYFSNLFKIKIENHFFKFFDSSKLLLSKDLIEEFREPDRAFMVYFYLIKNLTKTIKIRTSNNNFVQYFILDNQFVNFLKIIESLKIFDRLYDTEFNFSKIGIFGLDTLIHGIIFIYSVITKLLGFDEENKFKSVVDSFIENLICEFGKVRNMSTERFIKNKSNYYDNIMKYIAENKIELLKGY